MTNDKLKACKLYYSLRTDKKIRQITVLDKSTLSLMEEKKRKII